MHPPLLCLHTLPREIEKSRYFTYNEKIILNYYLFYRGKIIYSLSSRYLISFISGLCSKFISYIK